MRREYINTRLTSRLSVVCKAERIFLAAGHLGLLYGQTCCMFVYEINTTFNSRKSYNVYNAFNLRQSSYNGNSYFRNVQITITPYITVDLLMSFYGFISSPWWVAASNKSINKAAKK